MALILLDVCGERILHQSLLCNVRNVRNERWRIYSSNELACCFSKNKSILKPLNVMISLEFSLNSFSLNEEIFQGCKVFLRKNRWSDLSFWYSSSIISLFSKFSLVEFAKATWHTFQPMPPHQKISYIFPKNFFREWNILVPSPKNVWYFSKKKFVMQNWNKKKCTLKRVSHIFPNKGSHHILRWLLII